MTTLTKSNMTSFGSRIPNDALTKTIREAIQVVRCLDIDYLWIDTFCIIQDDGQDWAKESVQMARIYGSAVLNIAATSAKDGQDGLFFQRQPSWRCQFKLPDSAEGRLYNCYASESVIPTNAPLFDRAWVAQEMYMSVRKLHFCRDQVLWSCQEMSASEIFPRGTSEDSQLRDWRIEEDDFDNFWNDLIERYSIAKLTRDSDRIVALSGLAEALHAKTRDDYLVGMWRSNIYSGLLWAVRERDLRKPRPRQYRAPTWSWLSIDSPVESFKSKLRSWYCTVAVLDTQITYSTTSQFGDVKSAVLRIQYEYLCPVVLKPRAANDPLWRMIIGDKESDESAVFFDYVTEANDRNLLLLPFVDANRSFQALLIERVEGSPQRYERVGVCTIHSADLREIARALGEQCCSTMKDSDKVIELV